MTDKFPYTPEQIRDGFLTHGLIPDPMTWFERGRADALGVAALLAFLDLGVDEVTAWRLATAGNLFEFADLLGISWEHASDITFGFYVQSRGYALETLHVLTPGVCFGWECGRLAATAT